MRLNTQLNIFSLCQTVNDSVNASVEKAIPSLPENQLYPFSVLPGLMKQEASYGLVRAAGAELRRRARRIDGCS
jgi:hypothetical protein